MAWKKPSPETVRAYEALVPDDPRVERRQMFGFPCSFAQGQMFLCVFEEAIALRLAEADRQALLAEPGAAPFEPMPGRPMREYVQLPPDLQADPARAADWVGRSLDYALSLPPKAKKPRKRSGKKAAGA